MIEEILSFDNRLFNFINHFPHNVFFDIFFGFITLIGYLGAIWLVIALILAVKHKKKAKNLLTAVLVAEAAYLFFVEVFLKNQFARLRPKFALPEAILPYDFFDSFSFPSGHATIAFAAAFILGREDKKRRWCYWLLAILIAFSRIYLGKHYPGDVVAGALLGLFIGFLSIKLVNKISRS